MVPFILAARAERPKFRVLRCIGFEPRAPEGAPVLCHCTGWAQSRREKGARLPGLGVSGLGLRGFHGHPYMNA